MTVANLPMQAALAALWKKNRPVMRERLDLLQQAAEELVSTRTLRSGLRSEAASVAHKLAGSLGMFGLHGGTEAARNLEQTLEHDGLPQPERLRMQVEALRAILEPHLED